VRSRRNISPDLLPFMPISQSSSPQERPSGFTLKGQLMMASRLLLCGRSCGTPAFRAERLALEQSQIFRSTSFYSASRRALKGFLLSEKIPSRSLRNISRCSSHECAGFRSAMALTRFR